MLLSEHIGAPFEQARFSRFNASCLLSSHRMAANERAQREMFGRPVNDRRFCAAGIGHYGIRLHESGHCWNQLDDTRDRVGKIHKVGLGDRVLDGCAFVYHPQRHGLRDRRLRAHSDDSCQRAYFTQRERK